MVNIGILAWSLLAWGRLHPAGRSTVPQSRCRLFVLFNRSFHSINNEAL